MSPKHFFAALVVVVVAACTGPELRQPIEAVSPKPPLMFSVAELALEDQSNLPAAMGFRDRERSGRLLEATKEFLDERVAAMLQQFERDEVLAMQDETGKVVVTCEFCSRVYRFTTDDVAALFEDSLH